MMPTIKFKRTKENFTCKKCGFKVIGSGYTNHCPECLWSRHVDIHPGDRQAGCGGIMEPISVEIKKDSYVIIHHCLKCGLKKSNKTTAEDNFNAILRLSI